MLDGQTSYPAFVGGVGHARARRSTREGPCWRRLLRPVPVRRVVARGDPGGDFPRAWKPGPGASVARHGLGVGAVRAPFRGRRPRPRGPRGGVARGAMFAGDGSGVARDAAGRRRCGRPVTAVLVAVALGRIPAPRHRPLRRGPARLVRAPRRVDSGRRSGGRSSPIGAGTPSTSPSRTPHSSGSGSRWRRSGGQPRRSSRGGVALRRHRRGTRAGRSSRRPCPRSRRTSASGA